MPVHNSMSNHNIAIEEHQAGNGVSTVAVAAANESSQVHCISSVHSILINVKFIGAGRTSWRL